MKNIYAAPTLMSFLSFSIKKGSAPFKNSISYSFLLFITMLMIGNSSWAQAPTISSFTPTSGALGTVVTLTGTNFNTTAANNIVKFGATKATVSAATATSLTVTVPAGATYEPVSVLNTATALMGASLKPFISTFSPNRGDITIGDIMNEVELDFGVQAYGVAIGDLDGDGKPDLAVPNRGQGNILIFRNISNSGSISATSFSSRVEIISSTQSPRSIAISDLDGDGKPDLVVTNDNGFSISVFRNTSTPGSITVNSFASPVSFYGGQNPVSVTIGDLDADGKPDLVVPCDGGVSVFRNTSTSGSIDINSFAASVSFAVGLSPSSVAIADLNGDGKLDLAVANRASDTVSVLRNTSSSGSISLQAKEDFAVGSSPYFISMGDFDGDGKPDLAVANNGNNTVSVLRNTSSIGTISLQAKEDFAVGSSPISLAIGDLDGDGKVDLAVANYSGKSISVLRNTCSNGIINANSFAAKVDFATAVSPNQVAIGDLDGDGKPDMVAGEGNQINLFKNNPVILPPTITSFSPTSGLVGTSVTITGTNYTTMAANNVVKFGSTQATVTAATSTSLTVIVPAGATYQPITVLNTSTQLMCTASKPFITTFTPAKNDLTNQDIMAKVDLAAGANPISVAIGDLDGDGKSDLAVVNKGSTSVSIYRNISGGGSITISSFAVKVDYTTGTSPNSVSVGDLNGDGKADLAIANSGGTTVSVFLNTSVSGSISFATKADFTVGTSPYSLSMGDLDGDGKADLAVANYNSSTVSVLRNTSTINSISFATKVDFSTASSKPYSVAMGDLDGDGKADLAVANNNSSTFSIFHNTSTSGIISFNPKVDFATGLNPSSVAIGDLDGDGKADIVVANSSNQSVSVFRNTSSIGSISVSAKVDFTTGFGPQSIVIGDLDGDGKVDLLTSNAGGPSVSVLRNKSVSGSIDISSFASRVDFTTGASPLSVAVGDLDDDGKPDLVVANYGASSVSVLKNNPLFPPTVTSLTPTSGPVGTLVTITGTSFSTTVSNNIVKFGATKATVSSASATSLTVTVPAGATYESVSILNTATALMGASQKIFLPTFSPNKADLTINDILPKVDFATTGTQSYYAAIADVDGDGKPDLAVANYASGTVSVFHNTSSSGTITSASFAAKVDFATGANPISIAIGDLNGDGKPELAVTNYGSATVSVFLNTASSGVITTGSFAAKVDFATGTNPRSVAIGDLDGDGKADLAIANTTDSTVSILRNTATTASISFAAKVDYATGSAPHFVAIGDLDGDGKPDLATANNGSASVSVLHNISTSGTISLETNVDFTAGSSPVSVAIGDLDNDGRADLVVANFSSATLSVFKNTVTASPPSISFATKVDFTTGAGAWSVAIGDLDGDGKPDLAVANAGVASVSVFRNTTSTSSITTASFATKVDFATATATRAVAIADVDLDGKADIVAANYTTASISILRNNPTYGITYNGNINTSGTVPVVSYTSIGTSATVSANTGILTKTGYTFAGWNTLANGSGTSYAATGSATFTINVNVTLYAQWTANTLTVTYNSQLGSAISNGTATTGVAIASSPGTPTRAGYTFNGWFAATTGGSAIVFPYTHGQTSSFTLFVQWTANTLTVTYDSQSGSAISNVTTTTGGSIASSPGTPTRAGHTFNGWFAATTGGSAIVFPYTHGQTSNFTLYAQWTANYTLGNYTNTSIATAGGNVSITPSAVPTGGASVTVYTTTHFKGILTVNPSTGVVRITDAHPAGTYVATVDAGFGITKTFTLTVGNTLCSQGQFYASSTPGIAVGSNPLSVAIGDFNGDGAQDIAVGNEIGNKVSISLGDGSGGFSNTTNVDVGQGGTFSIAIGDFNGDGNQDMAATNKGSSSVSIRLGDGLGGFSSTTDVAVGSGPQSVVIGDFNKDGKQDMATANASSSSVSIRLGNGLGAFSGTTDFTIGSGPQSVVIGDFNSDGNQDIAAANSNISSVSILLGNGLGGFSVAADVAVGSAPRSVAIGDFNGDGNQDIATANNAVNNFGLSSVSIRLGDGLGGFSGNTEVAVGLYSSSVAIGDFNGDGKQDIASANGNDVSIRLGDGLGGFSGFSGSTDIAFAGFNYSLGIGDFNGDGRQDFVTANYNFGTVSIRFGGIAAINLKGNLVDIVSGDITPSTADDTDYGTVLLNTPKTKTYTIQNTGTGLLTIKTIEISGTNSALFTKSQFLSLPISIPVGASATFTLTFRSTSVGTKTAIVTFNNDDCDESAYSFKVQAFTLPTLGNYSNTSIVTASGNTTVTPDAAPTIGTSATVHTTTNFKGTLTVNSTSGVVTITNAYPAGVYTVTVDAGFGIFKNFILTVGNTLCSAGKFNLTSYTLPGTTPAPTSIAVGDFDGDGIQDLATTNYNINTVTISLGNGDGTFANGTDLADFARPSSIAVGDFNNDGNQDIATINNSLRTVATNLGNGDGTFAVANQVTLNTNVVHITLGYFDNDKFLDFATANSTSNSVSIGLGIGDGTFAVSTPITVANRPDKVAMGNFNSDGFQDIIVTNGLGSSVTVLTNDGNGVFTVAASPYEIGTKPSSIVTGDFNGDSFPDIAVAHSTATAGISKVSVRFGDGNGGFTGSTVSDDYSVGNAALFITIGDFNGDGFQDFAASTVIDAIVTIYFGNGAGAFVNSVTSLVGGIPSFITTGNFNNDGYQDFITVDQGSNYLKIGLGGAAEVNLKGNANNIVSGDATPATTDDTDFGNVVLNTPTIKTYTIENAGTAALSISSIVSSGTDSADFVVGGITLPATIAAGTNNTFTLTFTPTTSGTKTAAVTITNDDCALSSYTFAVQGGNESLNTTDFSTIKLNFYPNPVKEILTISLDKTDLIKAYEIYDISGKRVDFNTNYNSNHIKVSGFSSGVYLLKVQTDLGMMTAKFIKE